MSTTSSHTLNWLLRFHAATTSRLPSSAERMILFAAAAELNEGPRAAKSGNPSKINDSAYHVSHRALAENRRHTHFKSDNRTAV